MPKNLLSSLAFLRAKPAAVVTGLLLIQAVAFYAAPTTEFVPNPPPLSAFSKDLSPWHLYGEMALDKETQDLLKADDTTNRVYTSAEGPMFLFVAFFKSQRGGVTPHSPKICLPGSGWTPETSSVVSMDVPGEGSLSVNRYIVSKGPARNLIFYWYATAHHTMADEYVSKLYLMDEGLRHRRSDEAVYRVISPIGEDGEMAAQARAAKFVALFYPDMKKQMWEKQ